MPGRTPNDAVKAFLRPIKTALSCIAQAKMTTIPNGGWAVGAVCQWNLNYSSSVELKSRGKSTLAFSAAMDWEVVEDSRAGYGPFRVTTRAYQYSLDEDGRELWALHWHPNSLNSSVTTPHIHLKEAARGIKSLPDNHHLTVGRMTFEDAVRWCIEWGAEPIKKDWRNRLEESERAHLKHRSWSARPPEVGG